MFFPDLRKSIQVHNSRPIFTKSDPDLHWLSSMGIEAMNFWMFWWTGDDACHIISCFICPFWIKSYALFGLATFIGKITKWVVWNDFCQNQPAGYLKHLLEDPLCSIGDVDCRFPSNPEYSQNGLSIQSDLWVVENSLWVGRSRVSGCRNQILPVRNGFQVAFLLEFWIVACQKSPCVWSNFFFWGGRFQKGSTGITKNSLQKNKNSLFQEKCRDTTKDSFTHRY